MLRLPHLSERTRPTRTFLRLALPHVGLVILVTFYLLFGTIVFYYLERPHDQQARITAKRNLNRQIRHLTSLIHVHSKYYTPPSNPFFDAAADDNTTSNDSDLSIYVANEEEMSGSGSGMFADIWTEQEIDRIDYTQRLEKQIYTLMHQWEDAIRGFDIRVGHMFDGDLLVDTLWASENTSQAHLAATESRWTFSASVLFAFTVITTIGYGNLTPSTFKGRVFCMAYGLIGIPLTMLAIANTGRFLSDFVELLMDKVRREYEFRKVKRRVSLKQRRRSHIAGKFFHEVIKREDIKLEPISKAWGRIFLLLCFASYIVAGALCLPLWEEMNFFDGCYFSFVTITTVGFGDIVPRRYDYLFPTLVYITIGLAITTLTIEVFGGCLRQIHYLGSKIKGAKNAFIWFGSKMLTVQELVTAIGRQYGIPQAEIETLNSNMDQVVKETVQQKEEEVRSNKHRKAVGRPRRDDSKLAPLFADYEFRYIDEDSVAGTPLYNERFALWKQQHQAA